MVGFLQSSNVGDSAPAGLMPPPRGPAVGGMRLLLVVFGQTGAVLNPKLPSGSGARPPNP